MALNINNFRALANTQDSTAILATGEKVHTASGKESISRAFSLPSTRKAQNTEINRLFLETIEREYGADARAVAREMINNLAKPLTGRVVHNVLARLRDFPATAVSDILDANRVVMAPFLLNDRANVEGSFGKMFSEIMNAVSRQWGDVRVELSEKERIALKEAIMDEALKGNGSLEHPTALTAERLKEIATAHITECLTDHAEQAAGVRVAYVEAPEDIEGVFQNVAASLCERKLDFANVFNALEFAGRACRFEASDVKDRLDVDGIEKYKATMKENILQMVSTLSDWQLQRLAQHLANTSLHETLHNSFLEARRFDTSILSSMACADCGGAVSVAKKLATAVRQACVDRNLEVPAPYTKDISPASAQELAQSTLESAREYVDASMHGILKELAACRSDADGEKVIDSLIRLRTDCLGPMPRAREMQKFESLFLQRLNEQVQKMGNFELFDLFKGVCSLGIMHARIILPKEGTTLGASLLGDLNELESLINLEIADRVCAGATTVRDNDVISPATLKILTDAERVAMQRGLVMQSDDYLVSGQGERKELSDEVERISTEIREAGFTPPTIAEFVQTLRESDLTINLNPMVFFMSDTASKEVKNIFQLTVDKGLHYRDRRLFTEQMQFRGIVDLDRQFGEVRGEFHPVSAALNVGRRIDGASAFYGINGFVVLKDEVKQTRTTFTPQDSFYSFHQEVTQEKVDSLPDALRAAIKEFPEPYKSFVIPDAIIAGYKDAFQAEVGKSFGARSGLHIENVYSPSLGDVRDASGKTLSLDEKGQLGAFFDVALIKHFTATSVSDNFVATYETMAQLFESVDTRLLSVWDEVQNSPDSVNISIGNYIEAQIHGGVDLRHDVKEIHILDEVTRTSQGRAMLERAKAFCQEHGIALCIYSDSDRYKTSIHDVYTVAHAFPEPGVPTNPSFAEFKKELPAIFEIYKQHELAFDPTDIHGRGHISRALIYGKVLVGMFKEAGMPIDEYTLYRAIAFHDSGRRANGEDVFEADSAGNFETYLRGHGITNEEYVGASRGLINRGEDGQTTLEGIILQSSDSLDIIRVCGKGRYNTNLLGFMKKTMTRDGLYLNRDPIVIRTLVNEVARFIELTTPAIEMPMPQPRETPEAFHARMDAFNQSLQAKLEAEPNEGYFERNFENVLMAHKEDFPLLYKYYTL